MATICVVSNPASSISARALADKEVDHTSRSQDHHCEGDLSGYQQIPPPQTSSHLTTGRLSAVHRHIQIRPCVDVQRAGQSPDRKTLINAKAMLNRMARSSRRNGIISADCETISYITDRTSARGIPASPSPRTAPASAIRKLSGEQLANQPQSGPRRAQVPDRDLAFAARTQPG